MIINSTGALRFGSKRSGPSEWAAHPGERLQPGALRGPRTPVGVSLRWSPGALGPAAPDTWRSEGTVLGNRSASLCRAGTRTGTPPPAVFQRSVPNDVHNCLYERKTIFISPKTRNYCVDMCLPCCLTVLGALLFHPFSLCAVCSGMLGRRPVGQSAALASGVSPDNVSLSLWHYPACVCLLWGLYYKRRQLRDAFLGPCLTQSALHPSGYLSYIPGSKRPMGIKSILCSFRVDLFLSDDPLLSCHWRELMDQERNTGDPWTTQGLGMLTPGATENLHMTFNSPHT